MRLRFLRLFDTKISLFLTRGNPLLTYPPFGTTSSAPGLAVMGNEEMIYDGWDSFLFMQRA